MKIFKIILLFIITSLPLIQSFSQNDPQISHYMFMQNIYNPAYTGSNGFINASLLARQQWTGFTLPPSTQIFNFEIKSAIGGLGLSIVNDKLGYERTLKFKLNYGFHIAIDENSQLSLGISGGAMDRSLDGTKLIYEDKTVVDPNGIYQLQNAISPAIDAGIKYSNQSFSFGISATQVHNSLPNKDFYTLTRHLYIFTDYRYKLNEKINIIPSFYAKYSGFILIWELNTRAIFNDKFWGGITYRQDEAMIAQVGLQIKQTYKVGYSYDLNTGAVKSRSSGSHEIYLAASFGKPEKKRLYHKSPRLFN